jgi:hypothetical protein
MLSGILRGTVVLTLALLLAVGAPAAADEADIAQLAPRRSFLLVSIPDFQRVRTAFERSELGALWAEPAVRTFLEEATRERMRQLREVLAEIEASPDDLAPPTGAVGIALFLPEPAARFGLGVFSNPRRSMPAPDLLAVADMGQNAEALQHLLDRLIDRAVKDKKATTEEAAHAGARIVTVKLPRHPGGEEDAEASAEEVPEQRGPLNALVGPLSPRSQLSVARLGATFLVSTDLSTLESSLDTLDGRRGPSLADNDDFRASITQHPARQLARGVLLIAPILDLLARDIEASSGKDQAVAFRSLMDSLGFGAVRSLSLGLRFDTPEGTIDVSSAALIPEKKGLVALLVPPRVPLDPPAFVPPDAGAVARISFRFDGLYDVLRAAAASLPGEARQQATGILDQGVNIVKPGLDVCGPIVHWWMCYRRPLAEDSRQVAIAIDARDSAVVANTLTLLTNQGFQSRNFEGHAIYTHQFLPMSIGLGFDRLFIGRAAAVEDAMRLAARADSPKPAAEPVFREAACLISDDAVIAHYADTGQTIRWLYWSLQNQRKTLEAQDMPKHRKQAMLESLAWIEKLPPIDTMLRHLGNTATELRSTPDGFRGRTVMLRPSADSK